MGLEPRKTVDIDVVRRRTESHMSANKHTKVPEFTQALWERDGSTCAFSGWGGQAIHIIPFTSTD